MLRMDSLAAARHFEVLGDPLVEPQRHGGNDGVDVAVCRLVAEILGDPVLPRREYRERRVGFDEERPPHREVGKVTGGEAVVAAGVGEEIEMDRLVGDRQTEILRDLRPHRLEITDETMLLGEAEVGVDHQLARLDDVSIREPFLPLALAAESTADRLLEPGRVERRHGGEVAAPQHHKRRGEHDEEGGKPPAQISVTPVVLDDDHAEARGEQDSAGEAAAARGRMVAGPPGPTNPTVSPPIPLLDCRPGLLARTVRTASERVSPGRKGPDSAANGELAEPPQRPGEHLEPHRAAEDRGSPRPQCPAGDVPAGKGIEDHDRHAGAIGHEQPQPLEIGVVEAAGIPDHEPVGRGELGPQKRSLPDRMTGGGKKIDEPVEIEGRPGCHRDRRERADGARLGLEGGGFVESLLAAHGGGQTEGSGEASIEIGKPPGQAPTGVVPGQFLDPRQRRPAPPSAVAEARGDGEDRRQRKAQ